MRVISFIMIGILIPIASICQNVEGNSYSSNAYNQSIELNVNSNIQFSTFTLSNQNSSPFVDDETLRNYHGISHYFSFRMPENDGVHILMNFPKLTHANIAAYCEIDRKWVKQNTAYLKNSPGKLTLNNNIDIKGKKIIVRVWFNDQIEKYHNNIDVCVKSSQINYASKNRNITVSTNTYTPQQLVQDVLVTGCLEAFNVTYNGDPISLGYFTGSIGTTEFTEGIILTSGDANLATGPNSSGSTTHDSNGGYDVDLQSLIPGYSIYDAAVLEFDFIPASDSLQFDFLFGSEEYMEYVSSSFNDVFGFFLSGPGINGPYSNNAANIALIPGTNLPVTIDNVNANNNAGYYVSNSYNGDVEYDGITIPLTAKTTVQACEIYHIKMGIADAGDSSYDSGVFLNAKSFISGDDFTIDLFNPWYQTNEVYEGCETMIAFKRTDTLDLSEEIVIEMSLLGTATPGVDVSDIPTTFVIPIGQIADTLTIESYADGIIEGPEYFIFSYNNGCPCSPAIVQDTVWVYDEFNPQVNISNSGPICSGETATLSIAHDPSLEDDLVDCTWLINGSNEYNINVSPTSTTTYEVEVSYPCQTVSYFTTVEVHDNPSVYLGTDQTMCDYELPITLDAGTGFNYAWNTGDNTQTINPTTTGNFSVTVTDANGCTADDDVDVTINAAPTVDLGADQTVCDYELPISLDAGAGFTYNWSTNEVSQIINPATSGNYSVVITDGNGCTATGEVIITINQAPTVDLGADQTLCDYELPITLDAGAGFNYAWNTGENTQTINPTSSGNYSVTITDANGCSADDEDDINITINAAPTVDLGIDQTVCDYELPIALDAGTGFTYNWSTSETTQIINPTNSGNYSVVITDGNGCTATDEAVVTINQAPTVDLGADQTLCDYELPITLDAGTGFNYAWNTGDNTQTINPTTSGNYSVIISDVNGCTAEDDVDITINAAPTVDLGADQTVCDYELPITLDAGAGFTYNWSTSETTQIINPTTSGNYSVVITDGNGCTATDEAIVTINQAPTVDLGADQTLCDYELPITLDAGTGFNYSWNTGDNTQTINPTASGNYSVVISDANGCTAEDDVDITINAAPTVDLGADQTVCDYELPITLDAGTGFIYNWSTNETTQIINPTTSGNYSVVITDGNGCTATDEAVVTINQAPTVDLGADQTICDYELPITLDAGTGFNYSWNTGDNTQTINPTSSANYSVTISDANGCSAEDDVDITINAAPIVNLGADQTVCDYELPISLDAGAGFTYSWSTSETTQIINPTTSGNYSVVITDGNGCTATDEAVVTINQAPTVDLGADQTLCDYELPITLDAGTGFNYAWNTGDNTQTINPTTSGNYSVIISDANGCSAEDDVNITINAAPTVDLGADQIVCDYELPISLDAGVGFTYSWSTSETTQIINPTTSGNYSVVITDWNGCTATDEAIVTINQAPTVDLGADQTLCDYELPITLDAGTGFNYSWNTGDNTQTINPTTSGNYSVIISDANGCSAEDDVDITINTAPTVDLGADQTVCDYELPIALDAGAGFTYSWSTSETTQIINPTTSGNYSVVITDGNGCTATDEAVVTINQAPTVDLGTDQTLCDYELPITLDAGTGFNFAWSTGDNSQTINPTYSANYSVTISDANGCTAEDAVDITINAAPTVDLGTDQTVCETSTPILLDAGANFNYVWSNGDITQTINVTNTGNYSVTITDSNGCTGEDQVNIDVIPALIVDLGADQTLCDYELPITLDAGAGFNYSWNTGDNTQTINPTSSGNYSVIISDANGCSAEDDVNITINAAPTVDLGADQTVCDYALPIALDAGAGFTYNWSTSETTQIINPTTSGNYSVVITDGNGCTATDEAVVTINQAPTVDLGADQTLCDYELPITLDAGTGFNYTWNTGDNTQTINPTSSANYSVVISDANGCTADDDVNVTINAAPTVDLGADQILCDYELPISLDAGAGFTYSWSTSETTQIINPTTSGNYSVVITDGNGCTATDEAVITINQAPTVDLGADQTLCDYELPITLDAGAGFNYSWNTGDNTQTIYPTTSGNYSVVISDANGCSAEDDVNITINAAPTVDLGTDQIVCDYELPIALDAGAGFTYNWSTSETTQIINPTTSGNYSVVITDGNGCTATDEAVVIINQAPTVDLGADQTLCDYELPITLDAGTGFNYTWNTGDNTQTINPTTSGNYSVVISDANGCSAEDDVNITINAAPTVDLGADQTVCDYQLPISLDAGAGFTYSWSTSETTQIINPTTSGNYSVVITDGNGCTATDEAVVTINQAPTVNLGADQTLCDYELPITLDAGTGFNYAWNTGDNTQTINPTTSGNYSVIISDANGCTAEDDVDITINAAPTVDLEADQTVCDYELPISLDAGVGFTYSWSTSETTQIINPTTSGNYSVVITDGNGCTATDEAIVTINQAPTVDLGADQTICDYELPITLDAGTGFNYTWSTGDNSQTINPTTSGNYSVVISDTNGCTAEDDVNITINAAPTIDLGADQTVCDYELPISLDAGAGFTYNWSTSETTQIINPTTSGNYTVVITDGNGCTATDEAVVTINQTPTVDLGADQTLCDYELPITLDAGTGFNYSWNTGDNTQTINPTISGNYSVIISDANGCSAEDDVNITINTTPTVDLGADQTVCDYELPISLDAGAGFTYSWSTSETTQIINPTTSGNYSVVITDGNGCTATDETIVTINQAPTVDLGANQTLCDYELPITLDAGTGFNYSWNTGDNTQTINPTTSGNYSVIISDANGCSAEDDVNITINAAPTVDLGADQTVCDYELPITLDAGAGFTYSWSTNETTQIINPTTSGNYSVVITDGNGCTATDEAVVTINQAPTVDLGADQTLCNYELPITLDAGTGFNYSWNTGESTQTINPTTSGNYSVVISDTNGCSAEDDVDITINAAPTVDLGADQTVCETSTPILLDAGSNFNYAWSNGDITQTINVTNTGNYSVTITDSNGCTGEDQVNIDVIPALIVDLGADQTLCNYELPITLDAGTGFNYSWNTGDNTQTINPTTSGNYSVIISDANGCSAEDNVDVTINAAPTVDLGADQTVCDYELPITLDAGAGFTYSWSTSETTQIINPTTSGNYSVVITDGNGCTATDEAVVTINQAPTVDLGADQTLCDYELPITLDAGTGFNYSWNTGDNTQTINPTISGNYSVIISDANGCSAEDDVNITINTAPTVDLGADQIVCDYELPITLDAGAGFTYSWSTSETTQIINPTTSGNYSVVITDGNGCTATNEAVVTINQSPTVDLGADQTLCDYELPITLDAGTGFNYSWNTGDSTQTINPTTSGNYSVIISDANGCSAEDDVNITINATPTVDLGADQTVCDYELPITLDAGAGFTYNWSNSETTQIINPTTSGNYSVVITDGNGCTATDAAVVTINQAPTVDLGVNQTLCDYELPITLDAGTGFNYSWNTGDNTQTINPTTSGNYSVIISDANGCSAEDDVDVTINAAPTVDLGADQTVCETSTPILLDAGANFNYAWSNGDITQTINVTNTGNYSVTITDSNGCTGEDQVNIDVIPALIVDLGADQTLCDYELPITLDAGAGFNYTWNTGESTQTINPTTSGNYSVIISDANGCSAEDDVNITINAAPTVDLGADQTVCDYELPITLDAGVGFTYSWSTSETTQIINPTTSGNYSVVITDGNGCTATDEISVTLHPNPVVNLPDSESYCSHEFPIDIVGPDNMVYEWSNGSNNQICSVESAGIYHLTITDNNGCTNNDEITIIQHDDPYLNIGEDLQVCETELPVTLSSSGFASYAWSTGDNNSSIDVNESGTYQLTVTDNNGCFTTDTIEIAVEEIPYIYIQPVDPICENSSTILLTANQEGEWSGIAVINTITGEFDPNLGAVGNNEINFHYSTELCEATLTETVIIAQNPIILIQTQEDPSCFGSNDGTISVSNENEDNTIYTWDTGFQGQTIQNLPSGTFSVEAQSEYGCVSDTSITLIEPEAIAISNSESIDITCHGDADGSITVEANGGSGIYYYSWNTGSTDPSASNLSAGTYTLTITDSNSCQLVSEFAISEPDQLTIDETLTPYMCGQHYGAIEVQATGGTGDYDYQWDQIGLVGNSISQLTNGVYTLILSDENNCSISETYNIPIEGALTLNIEQENDIQCHNELSAILSANCSTQPGAPQIEYLWNNGMTGQSITNIGEGIYAVTATDIGGCSASTELYVPQPDPIIVQYLVKDILCKNQKDGEISALATGGTNEIFYQWSTGSTDTIITNLSSGIYTLTVNDSNDCLEILSISVPEPENALEANVLSKDITCFGENDGKIVTEAMGGTGPYHYSWTSNNFIAELPLITYLEAGDYTLEITDKNNCKVDTVITIIEPEEIHVNYITTDPSCIGNDNGSIEFTANGGISPYKFETDIMTQNEGYFSGLFEGHYDFTISDSVGCKVKIGTIVLMDIMEECIRVPDVFTPNGDGTNDTFIIENIQDYPNAIISIFNRWGQQLYAGGHADLPWDGTYKGQAVPAGTYLYVIDLHNNAEPKSGTITVVY